MWKGVRTYVDGLVEDHILSELVRINPNLERRQKKRLREMVHKLSQVVLVSLVSKIEIIIKS